MLRRSSAPIRLEGNAAVDTELLETAERLSNEMVRLGIPALEHYRIAPALGGSVMSQPLRVATKAQNAQLGPVPHPVNNGT